MNLKPIKNGMMLRLYKSTENGIVILKELKTVFWINSESPVNPPGKRFALWTKVLILTAISNPPRTTRKKRLISRKTDLDSITVNISTKIESFHKIINIIRENRESVCNSML